MRSIPLVTVYPDFLKLQCSSTCSERSIGKVLGMTSRSMNAANAEDCLIRVSIKRLLALSQLHTLLLSCTHIQTHYAHASEVRMQPSAGDGISERRCICYLSREVDRLPHTKSAARRSSISAQRCVQLSTNTSTLGSRYGRSI